MSIDKKHNIFCFQLLNLFVQADAELSESHVRLKVRGDKNNMLFDRLYINVTSFIKVAHKPTNREAWPKPYTSYQIWEFLFDWCDTLITSLL